MHSFDEIFEMATKRHGDKGAVEAKLADLTPVSADELVALPDDRWLSMFTKCVFQAGFSWKVIDAKWPAFEEAFWKFDPHRCAMMSDDDLDALLSDNRIVRNAAKIISVRDNAVMLCDLAEEHGSAADFLARWPVADHVGLIDLLKHRGSRLGGTTAQYALRFIGRDGFVLTSSVIAALVREKVIERAVFSRHALTSVQAAFNGWVRESGRPMMQVSRLLALSVEE
ncbi:DNA-3-methyladenine glycosylase I [Breoghania corrubedonensis]|uniref:DNA-3-methyladenine glycosylase I n=1 Tax=Breoghania corrubedonensis TaxID=665038 RepID=A0A2T5VEQ1_9HYPH|nr:DNA-3-methyladenine glycosylase I [Breoghania corrubedonensis]PTW62239.1 DNA-3-methyladenine glycosylase I [Breoghania corrubedonensis]